MESLNYNHRLISRFSSPKAATVLMAVNTSSAIDPAIEYFICSRRQAVAAFLNIDIKHITFSVIQYCFNNFLFPLQPLY